MKPSPTNNFAASNKSPCTKAQWTSTSTATPLLFCTKPSKPVQQVNYECAFTSTNVDGVVLFLTPNGHSLNYRSATVHGEASLVPNDQIAKKRWAMRLLTNHMAKGRWGTTHPVAASAMKYVQVIEVRV